MHATSDKAVEGSKRRSIPVCPVCNAEMRPQQFADVTVQFCPAGHGAAIDGATLAAHVHHSAQSCGMHELLDHAPRVPATVATRRHSPWYSAQIMEPCDVEGIEIDFCPIERGVWLDAPEIVHILNLMRRKPGEKLPTATDVVSEITGDVILYMPDVWIDSAINTVDKAAEPTVAIVDAAGNVWDYGADIVVGIVEFIADAIP